jgi:hypothetical protein
MNKADLREMIERLPEEAEIDLDKLIYTLTIRQGIERGLAEADAGDVISLEEFEKNIDEWLA